MTTRVWLKHLVLSVIILLSGCHVTFQSNQYAFIKSLLEPDQLQPEQSWTASWDGRLYPVVAINYEGGTLFADQDGVLINFDGWQILDLALPGSRTKKIAVIEKVVAEDGSTQLTYADGLGRVLGSHACQAWQQELVAGAVDPTLMVISAWMQSCVDGETVYRNRIRLNEAGELVGLLFVLVPGEPPIQIDLG